MKINPSIRLQVPEDFRFEPNLGYLTRSASECLYQIRDGGIYRALPIPGTPIVMIRSAPDRDLVVKFLGAASELADELAPAAAAYIRDWLDLDTELTPFYRLAAADPILAAAVETHRGLRLIGIPDLYEALAWGILGQQINLAFAYTLKRRLVETYGGRIDHEGHAYWTFPRPETIAALDVRDLLPLKLTVKKCEYLIHTARLVADGTLSKEGLASLGFREAEQALVRIRGIGPWTANYVLMRCLRMKDAFPIDDVGLHHALRHVTGSAAKPSREDIRRMAAGWSGWEAYATFYLWRLLY
ncbi:DNA-3-methyladenine glycosylase family protein [Cohnella sp. 56]|uniref:DNA-3-methyladenine glycosylase family protein n=1 Tax=Cohnella sp. 56 TaxID=3113722 RepID=UPI0030E8738C